MNISPTFRNKVTDSVTINDYTDWETDVLTAESDRMTDAEALETRE
jgi:hypothetical protein